MDLDELAAQVGRLLKHRGLTFSVAESCTGGLLSHHITNIPGSSDYFLGGIVSYSYELKKTILGVPAETIVERGAVSWETALAMARGCRRLTEAHVTVAITGIAGPGGETPDKPVGLTYIALVAGDARVWERHLWRGTRRENKTSSVRAALLLLLRYLEHDLTPVPESEDEASQEEDWL